MSLMTLSLSIARPYRESIRDYRLLRFHDDIEISFCHRGVGVFVVNEKMFSFRPNDVLVINPHEMHFALARRGIPCIWTRILVGIGRLLMPYHGSSAVPESWRFGGESFHNLLRGAKYHDIRLMDVELIRELRQQNPGYPEAVRGLVLALMTKLQRLPNLGTDPKNDIRQMAIEADPSCAPAYAPTLSGKDPHQGSGRDLPSGDLDFPGNIS